LIVAGDGPERDRLRVRAGGRVELVGPLSASRVASLLREATLLVVPSLDGSSGTEAQGLAAIEAMASGCPIVVSRSGGLRELALDLADDGAPPVGGYTVGTRGLAVTPADPAALAGAIAHALDDEEGARARADAARDLALARYGWPRIEEALLAIYDEARC